MNMKTKLGLPVTECKEEMDELQRSTFELKTV